MGPYYERSASHRPVNNRTLLGGLSVDLAAERRAVQYKADKAELGEAAAWTKRMQGETTGASEGRLAAANSTGAKVRDVGTIAGPLPRQELTGKETGMQGPFVGNPIATVTIPLAMAKNIAETVGFYGDEYSIDDIAEQFLDIVDGIAGPRTFGRYADTAALVAADVVNEPHPEIAMGDEGPVHEPRGPYPTADEKRRDQQFPTDFAVITLDVDTRGGLVSGNVFFCTSEETADKLAATINGLAYKVHGDKAFTLTSESIA